MKLSTLNDLFAEQLKDIYSAERQLLLALPKMASAAASGNLSKAFKEHLQETENQVNRLEKISKSLGIKLTGKKCKAMEGLISEGKECLETEGEDYLIDGALMAAAQRVEHYEISAYGTASAIAQALGHDEAVKLLRASLEEEENADEKLTALCEIEVLKSNEDHQGDEDQEIDEDDDEDNVANL